MVKQKKKSIFFFYKLLIIQIKQRRLTWFNLLKKVKLDLNFYSIFFYKKLSFYLKTMLKNIIFLKKLSFFIRLKKKLKKKSFFSNLPWAVPFYSYRYRHYFFYWYRQKSISFWNPIQFLQYYKKKKNLILLKRRRWRRIKYGRFSYFFRHKYFLLSKKKNFLYKKRHIFFYFSKLFNCLQLKKQLLNKVSYLNLYNSFYIIPKKIFLNFIISKDTKKKKTSKILQFDFCYTYFFVNLWNRLLMKKKNFFNIKVLCDLLKLKNKITKFANNYNLKFTFINKLIVDFSHKNKSFGLFHNSKKKINFKRNWFLAILRLNSNWVKIRQKRRWKRKKYFRYINKRVLVIKQFFKKPINFLYYTIYSKINFFNFLNIILLRRWSRGVIRSIRRKKFYLFLLFRFPKTPIKRYKYFFKKRWFSFKRLPIFAGMRYKRKFSFYRGVFLSLGHYKYLPSNLTYSGFKIPFLIIQNKKAFWRSIAFCFKIYSYNFVNIFLSSFVTSYLHRLNLYTNFNINFSWMAATRMILYSRHFYRYISRYYFFGKHLLVPTFYSQIPLLTYNVKFFFRKYFTTQTSDLIKSKRSFRFRRPININNRQITVMRRIRQSLCSLFFNDPKRSWYITQFCSRFYRRIFTGFSYLYKLEMSLFSIVLRSRIVYTVDEAFFLIQNGLVFVNGLQCTDVYTIINQNDRIQFVLSKALHLYHRAELSFSNFYRKKLKAYVLSFKTRKKHLKWKIGKKSWPLKHIWFNYDIPRYLEVDYLSMTIFVLYLPLNIKEMFTYNFLLNKFLTSKCYNWRFHY